MQNHGRYDARNTQVTAAEQTDDKGCGDISYYETASCTRDDTEAARNPAKTGAPAAPTRA